MIVVMFQIMGMWSLQNFGTSHDSLAVMACAKICDNHHIVIWN